MRVCIRLLTAVLFFGPSFAGVTRAQKILFDTSTEPLGSGGYQVKWQPDVQRLIAYRDVGSPDLPAIRVLSNTGSNLPISPLKDFPGSAYIDIWDAAGAPNGDIVIAAIIGYGPRHSPTTPLKSMLLTYDQGGTLTKAWNVKPYHYHRVAVDSSGDIFALGDGGVGDYPLLVKYGASGQVLGGFLSSSSFSTSDAVVNLNSPNGEPELFIRNGRLHVWIAATRQLFVFSLDGVQLSAIPLSAAVQSITDLSGYPQLRFLGIDVDSNEEITCQFVLRPLAGSQLHPTVALAHLASNGSFGGWIEPASLGDVHRFVGFDTRGDKPVFLEKVNQKAVMINVSE
jgi:hypothetical protein